MDIGTGDFLIFKIPPPRGLGYSLYKGDFKIRFKKIASETCSEVDFSKEKVIVEVRLCQSKNEFIWITRQPRRKK